MPAGTDLQTWAPRVGASGDDRYDPGEFGAMRAGDADGYSEVVTIAEVNDGAGFNQVIAEINRRNRAFYDTRGSYSGGDSYAPLAYVERGTKIKASVFNTVKAAVDAVRTRSRQSLWSWTNFPVSTGQRIKREHMLELRKALAIDYFLVNAKLQDVSANAGYPHIQYDRTGTYPPDTDGSGNLLNSFPYGGSRVGQAAAFGTFFAYRSFHNFEVPANLPTLGAGKMAFSLGAMSFIGASFSSFTLELYRAAGFSSPVGLGDWGIYDTLEASETIGSEAGANKEWNLATVLSAGSNYTFTWLGGSERADSNPGPPFKQAIQIGISVPSLTYPFLKLYSA
ncbi:MAG: hypothetical protein KIS92_19970 [Planctomycetota bacterium]|nr:hypothetical protein [Planctomycetota bacterium]